MHCDAAKLTFVNSRLPWINFQLSIVTNLSFPISHCAIYLNFLKGKDLPYRKAWEGNLILSTSYTTVKPVSMICFHLLKHSNWHSSCCGPVPQNTRMKPNGLNLSRDVIKVMAVHQGKEKPLPWASINSKWYISNGPRNFPLIISIVYNKEFWINKPTLIFSKWIFFQNSLVTSWSHNQVKYA